MLSFVKLCCCTLLCFVSISHWNCTQIVHSSRWKEIDEALPIESSHKIGVLPLSPILNKDPDPFWTEKTTFGEWQTDEVVLWKINVPRLCDFNSLFLFLFLFFLNFSLETCIKKKEINRSSLCSKGPLYINGAATSLVKYSRVVLVKVLRSKYYFYYNSSA